MRKEVVMNNLIPAIIVGAIVLRFFWRDAAGLVGAEKFLEKKGKGIIFGLLACAAVLLLAYRIFPDILLRWYNSDWFWWSIGSIVAGSIAVGMRSALFGFIMIVAGLGLGTYDVYTNYNNVPFVWNMEAGESRSFTVEPDQIGEIERQEYDVYVINPRGDTVIKEVQQNSRLINEVTQRNNMDTLSHFSYHGNTSPDKFNGGSGTYWIYTKKKQHIEFKLFYK